MQPLVVSGDAVGGDFGGRGPHLLVGIVDDIRRPEWEQTPKLFLRAARPLGQLDLFILLLNRG